MRMCMSLFPLCGSQIIRLGGKCSDLLNHPICPTLRFFKIFVNPEPNGTPQSQHLGSRGGSGVKDQLHESCHSHFYSHYVCWYGNLGGQ